MKGKNEKESIEWFAGNEDFIIEYMPEQAKAYKEDNEKFWREIESYFTKKLVKRSKRKAILAFIERIIKINAGKMKGTPPTERKKRDSLRQCIRLARLANTNSLGLLLFNRGATWFLLIESIRKSSRWRSDKEYGNHLGNVITRVLEEIGVTPSELEKDFDRSLKKCAALIAQHKPSPAKTVRIIELLKQLDD